MPPGDLDHDRDCGSRVREGDVLTELEQAEDCSLLFGSSELLEGSGKMTSCAGGGGTTGPVVPVARRVELDPTPRPRYPDEELFDQKPIVEDDAHEWRQQGLLISEVWIVDGVEPGVISISKHST